MAAALVTGREGWHNFHHTYSKDYRALGHDKFLPFWNPAALLIRVLALLRLTYNLKKLAEKGMGHDVEINKVRYRLLFPTTATATELTETDESLVVAWMDEIPVQYSAGAVSFLVGHADRPGLSRPCPVVAWPREQSN